MPPTLRRGAIRAKTISSEILLIPALPAEALATF